MQFEVEMAADIDRIAAGDSTRRQVEVRKAVTLPCLGVVVVHRRVANFHASNVQRAGCILRCFIGIRLRTPRLLEVLPVVAPVTGDFEVQLETIQRSGTNGDLAIEQ